MKEGKELPSIEIIDGVLVIKITAEELKSIAERKPDCEYSVVNANGFLADFTETLKDFAHSNAVELGITELQYLFDEVIDHTYINGSEQIIDKNEN